MDHAVIGFQPDVYEMGCFALPLWDEYHDGSDPWKGLGNGKGMT